MWTAIHSRCIDNGTRWFLSPWLFLFRSYNSGNFSDIGFILYSFNFILVALRNVSPTMISALTSLWLTGKSGILNIQLWRYSQEASPLHWLVLGSNIKELAWVLLFYWNLLSSITIPVYRLLHHPLSCFSWPHCPFHHYTFLSFQYATGFPLSLSVTLA